MPKHIRNVQRFWKCSKIVFYYMYNFHNSIFVFFVHFVLFIILYILFINGGGWWWVVSGGGRSWWVVAGGGGLCREAPGGHRGKFPRTDFGLAVGIQSSNAARTPKASLVWGNNGLNLMICTTFLVENPKIPKLQNLQKMSYAIYINNQITL